VHGSEVHRWLVGRDLGELSDVEPPVRFGFGSTRSGTVDRVNRVNRGRRASGMTFLGRSSRSGGRF
jgi:hypothetical protein